MMCRVKYEKEHDESPLEVSQIRSEKQVGFLTKGIQNSFSQYCTYLLRGLE